MATYYEMDKYFYTEDHIGRPFILRDEDRDFSTGGLKQPSNVRPNRLFTADSRLVLSRVGSIKKEKLAVIIERLVGIIRK